MEILLIIPIMFFFLHEMHMQNACVHTFLIDLIITVRFHTFVQKLARSQLLTLHVEMIQDYNTACNLQARSSDRTQQDDRAGAYSSHVLQRIIKHTKTFHGRQQCACFQINCECHTRGTGVLCPVHEQGSKNVSTLTCCKV